MGWPKTFSNWIKDTDIQRLKSFDVVKTLYHTMNHVVFHRGIPEDLENRFYPRQNNILIIDDLMTQCNNDPRITRLFSVGSSHRNLIII